MIGETKGFISYNNQKPESVFIHIKSTLTKPINANWQAVQFLELAGPVNVVR